MSSGRIGQEWLERREGSPPLGEPFLQSLPMELQVSMNELGIVGGEDGSDLVRRHLVIQEDAGHPGEWAASSGCCIH